VTVVAVAGIGVWIGVQQLRYHEFLELGRMASRTLNQRHVIANDIRIRRAADALQTCTTMAHFCQILQRCLEPAGFDGFGVDVSAELPVGGEVCPFSHVGGSKLQFIWDHSVTSSETNWTLTFGLVAHDGNRLGTFTLYRKNTASPLRMDLDVFTATGFCGAVASMIEKKQDSWFVKGRKEQTQMPAFETVGPVMGPRVSQPIIVPTSG